MCLSQIEYYKKETPRTEEQIQNLIRAIEHNASLFEYMSEHGPSAFGEEGAMFKPVPAKFDVMDLSQLEASLHSAARDWTVLGQQEREETYIPIIEALNKYTDKKASVLIPGSGVCRLAAEIAAARAEYSVEANESAFIMLVLAFESLFTDESFIIHPYIHQLSGLNCFEDSLTEAVFPDRTHCLSCLMAGENSDGCNCIDPPALIEAGRLKLSAGIFEYNYANAFEAFDAIVACYFMDVVKSIPETLATFYRLLRPGGILISFGPYVTHEVNQGFFATATLDDIDAMAAKVGFAVRESKTINTSYAQNPKSHVIKRYDARLTVYVK